MVVPQFTESDLVMNVLGISNFCYENNATITALYINHFLNVNILVEFIFIHSLVQLIVTEYLLSCQSLF